MAKVLYFAYGSNMLTPRLRHESRCPSATRIGTATATDHAVVFHKRSNRDQTGKATLHPTAGGTVHGVLYEIGEAELVALDAAEGVGHGYERLDDFTVVCDGRMHAAATYIATDSHIDRDLVPFDWYHAMVIAGAREHGLPADYIATLERITATADHDATRAERAHATEMLRAAGFADLARRLGDD